MGRQLKFGRLASCALLSALLAFGASAQSITLISKPFAPPTAGSGESSGIILSGDGNWAIFSSIADNLVTNDNNGIILDVFLKDLQTGEIVMVSRSPEGENLQDHSIGVFISRGGSKVVFESDSPELVEGDDNDATDIFIYNRLDGQVTSLRAGNGEPGNGSSTFHASSADGRFILFASDASNLFESDLNEAGDLFLYDSQTGDSKLITQEHGGSGSAGGDPLGMITEWMEGSVSGDGAYVAYTSYATNLVGTPVDGMNSQIYLRNVADGSNLLLSQSAGGLPGEEESSAPEISKDGSVVAFLSNAELATPELYISLRDFEPGTFPDPTPNWASIWL